MSMMKHSRPPASATIAAGAASWIAMMVADLATRAPYEVHLGHLTSLNVDEFLIAALVGLPPAFAFAACVYAVVALSANRLRLSAASMLLSCVVAAPVAGAGLWLIGHALWSKGRTFADDVAAFTRGGSLAPWLFLSALVVGSVAFWVVFNHRTAQSSTRSESTA